MLAQAQAGRYNVRKKHSLITGKLLGGGKTGAFLLPVIDKIIDLKKKNAATEALKVNDSPYAIM